MLSVVVSLGMTRVYKGILACEVQNRKPLVLKDLRTYPQVIHSVRYWVNNEGAECAIFAP